MKKVSLLIALLVIISACFISCQKKAEEITTTETPITVTEDITAETTTEVEPTVAVEENQAAETTAAPVKAQNVKKVVTTKAAPAPKSTTTPTKENNKSTTVTTKPSKKQWTQSEVDAIVNDAKAYAKSKGFIIDLNLTTQGTSWRTPSSTESTKEKIKSQLKYLIDDSYDGVIQSFGHFVDGATINVVTEKYTDIDGYTQWEIYVVY